jgi:hypothetical protein
MLLGIKSKKQIFLRHLLMGSLSAILIYLFYLSYSSWGVQVKIWPEWNVDHAFWRSFAHAAFVLLFLTLIIGPLSKLWPFFHRFVSWRRELGIWFAILSFGHAYAIWDRWALWDINRFFGLEYVEALGGFAISRPEVGIMNMMAIVIFPMIILLAITSSDKAVNFLGISSWKWLHSSLINVIFYIAVLRWVLYSFFFFQPSLPNLSIYPPVWFLYPLLVMALIVVLLQVTAFINTVRRKTQDKRKILILFGVGLIFTLPMIMTVGSVVYLDSKIITKEDMNSVNNISQNYAQSFYLTIKDGNQNISIWANDIDNEPYFRQKVSINNVLVSEQVYRNDEKTLYIAQQSQNNELVWSKQEDVSLQDINFTSILSGPAAWAKQYGVGDHNIQVGNGSLSVSVLSVEEKNEMDVFNVPEIKTN